MRGLLTTLRRKSSSGSGAALLPELLNAVQTCVVLLPDDPSFDSCVKLCCDDLMIYGETREETDLVGKFLGNVFSALDDRVIASAVLLLPEMMDVPVTEFRRSFARLVIKPYAQWIVLVSTGRRSAAAEVYALALSCVQEWGTGWVGQGGGAVKELQEAYVGLKRIQGIPWPPITKRSNARAASTASYDRDGVSLDPSAPPAPDKPASLRPGSMRLFSSNETQHLRKDFDGFDQLLRLFHGELEAANDCRDLEANALIPDIMAELDRMGPQLRSMIEIVTNVSAGDAEIVTPLLEMNDRYVFLLERYTDIQKTKPSSVLHNPFDDEHVVVEAITNIFGCAAVEHLSPSNKLRPPPKPVAPAAPLLRTPRGEQNQDIFNFNEVGNRPAAVVVSPVNRKPPVRKQSNPFEDFDLL